MSLNSELTTLKYYFIYIYWEKRECIKDHDKDSLKKDPLKSKTMFQNGTNWNKIKNMKIKDETKHFHFPHNKFKNFTNDNIYNVVNI